MRALVALAVLAAACGSAAPTVASSTLPSPTVVPTPSVPPISFVPVSTPNPNATPARTSRSVTFRDLATGNSLTIDLSPGAFDRGRFSVATPKGVYGGALVRAALSSAGAPISLSYDGPMDFTENGSSASRGVTASLRGVIDPDAHAADAALTVDGTRYAIAARPPDGGSVAAMLDRLEKAVVADDAAAIYTFSSSELKASYTQAQFVSAWQAQSTSTARRITAMRRLVVGSVVTSDLGFATVEVRWSTDVTDPNGLHTAGMTGYLVFEDGEWRLWATSES